MTDLVVHPITVRLRSTVRGMDARPGVLLEGPNGWGEWSPVPGFPCDPVLALQAAREAAVGAWPVAVRNVIPVNALVGDDFDPERDGPALAGFATVKIKVGDLGDLDRVAAVRDVVGPHVALRVDANGCWDVDAARKCLDAMARFDIELAEQPVATLEDLAFIRRSSPIPIAADECIRSLDDVERMRRLGAADAIVLKVQACGGVHAALSWAERAGVPAIVSSMLETSVGLAAGVALAAALPELPYACGLGTGALLAADVTDAPLVPADGMLAVRVPSVDRAMVDALAAAVPSAFVAAQDRIV
jgi:O-succinylbenzoate synthase